MARVVVAFTLLLAGCRGCSSPPPPAPLPVAIDAAVDAAPPRLVPRGFLKGQLHAHTSASDDSPTAPRDVHRWYEGHGYDFIVFTDHSAVTDTDDTAMLTFPGVELTRNLYRCVPPAPHDEMCSLHTNALFVDKARAPVGYLSFGDEPSVSRRAVYEYEAKKAKELGGIAMLCHPNLGFVGPDAATVLELARHDGLGLIEIANEAWDSKNAGDAEHPGTEALWDTVLQRGARIFGTATDDAHQYGPDAIKMRERGEQPFEGDRGFVVVRAEKNEAAIRDAIVRGDFYSSTGVVFDTLTLDKDTITVTAREELSFEAIYAGGKVLRAEHTAHFDVRLPDSPYLRVRAKRGDGAMAWTQPIFR